MHALDASTPAGTNEPRRRREWTGARVIATLLIGLGCGTNGAEPATPSAESSTTEPSAGAERVPAPPPTDLAGAAPRPPEPEIPEDTTALTSRMRPRALSIPATRGGETKRFTFDGFHRGWFARLPAGRQHLLTPVYGDGKVYLGGGFASHSLFAYDARTGDPEWSASAPDGGPSAAIIEDGKVLFNTESCTLFAVDADSGRRLWSRWLGDPLMSQPSAANGLVFSGHVIDGESPGGLTAGDTSYGTGSGHRYGFTAMNLSNGRPRWTRPITRDVMNAAVLDGDDVFFTTMDGIVWRLDQRTGRTRWRRRLHATSAPWLEGDELHVTVRSRSGRDVSEKAMVLARDDGATVREHEGVSARFAGGRPDTDVQRGWAFEGSRATLVQGRAYQTIGNEVHCRDADTGELLWRRRYTEETRARPASPPAIAGGQLVFGTRDGVLFGLDIDTGMTAWAYDVGEPIAAQPTIGHGWVYASTTRGGLVALEVSDNSFDGWHMWGGNASHNGRILGAAAPQEDERPTEGSLALSGEPNEGEAAGFPLQGTTVHADVSGFVARVRVEQTFQNPYDRPVEAVYLFPLPDDAAVDAMELRTGERVIRANIRRREQAQVEYRAARDRGVLASLLEQERANLFRQSVANLAPGQEVRVVLSYTQVLPYAEGSYRFVYPMVAGPRYQPDDDAEGAVRQVVLAPGGERPDRVEVTISADLGTEVHSVESPTHAITERRQDDRVLVALAEGARPNRDLDVRFVIAGEAPTVAALTSAPEGDAPGHLALALHPRLDVPTDQVMARELVFLVDTSSSMHGRPMEMAKAAMHAAIEGLQPQDTFRVLAFSDTTSALSDAALRATEANVARANRFVDGMQALGATEMLRGVRAALEPDTEDDRMRIVLLMTDGYIGNESEVFREVHAHLGQSRLFPFGVGSAVNRYLLSRLAEVGRGDAQVVTLDESPEEAAIQFHQRIARPYLTDIAIDWGQLEVADAYPRRLPDLFADRPLVVHARYATGGTSDVVIRGRIAGRAFEQTVSVTLPSAGETREELRSVWARARIKDLMLAMALAPNPELQEEVTQLGLEHHLLTQWTAFVAIDEASRVDEESQTVHQPSQTPDGVTTPVRRPTSRARRRFRSASVPRIMASSATVGGGVFGGALGGVGYGRGAPSPNPRGMERRPPELNDAMDDHRGSRRRASDASRRLGDPTAASIRGPSPHACRPHAQLPRRAEPLAASRVRKPRPSPGRDRPRYALGMRSTLVVVLSLVLASGCLLDRTSLGADEDGGPRGGDAATDGSVSDAGCDPETCNGLDDDCDGLVDNGLEVACNSAGDALEGCAMGLDRRTNCTLGCTPGANFCWECDPSNTTLTCNDDGLALEGCTSDGRLNVDTCLTGCTAGDTMCAPCTTGATACDMGDLVTCVASMEQRQTCEFACVAAPTPTCTTCVPDTSECRESPDTAVQCAADGTISDSQACSLGCSIVGDVATCNECVPNTSRCGGDVVLTCDASGRETMMSCGPETKCVESGSSASCQEDCNPGCVGGTLTVCPSGDTESCPLGCNGAGTDCGTLRPSNVGDTIAMDAGAADLEVGSTGPERLFFFADNGQIIRVRSGMITVETVRASGSGLISGIYYDPVSQGGGNPNLGVWAVRSLTVAAGSAIYVLNGGGGATAAVLLVENDATVAGLIDASGANGLPGVSAAGVRGPAAARGGAIDSAGDGTGGGARAVANNDGGGGGGFGSAGGRDGSNEDTGGTTYGNAALIPLLAGSGGGGSRNGDAAGGDGGGALQISVGGTLTVTSTGTIGSAGRPGGAATGHGGGGGGGSGGAVLLEARTITVAGVVGVPGGGGGGGRHDPGSAAMRGIDWMPPSGSLRCLGGPGSVGTGAGNDGGDGADGSNSNGVVGTAGNNRSDDGGGGGGAGRIRLNALTTGDVTITGTATPNRSSSATSVGTISVN
ncbi:MAG: PQQ-binding-like beta-propeller repeat protein [Sandaracinaceae bacterium]